MEIPLDIKTVQEFFFTASFLSKFFRKYENDWLAGENSRSQDLFKDFVMNASGDIYLDDPDIDLNDHPHLFQLLSREHITNLRPYDIPQKIDHNPKLTKKENLETPGIMKKLIGFSNNFNEQNRLKLMKKHGKTIFTSDKVESDWTKYAENSIDDLEEGSKTSWDKILSSIDIPTSSVILCDQYIFARRKIIINNLIPILDHFSKLCDLKIPFVIISKHFPRDFELSDWKGKWETRLNSLYADSLRISLHFISGNIGKIHDRRLLTDYRLINFPVGFDVLDGTGKVKQNTEPSVRTLLSGKSSHKKTYNKVKEFLQNSADKTSKQYEKLYPS